jgi:hypothetical protein
VFDIKIIEHNDACGANMPDTKIIIDYYDEHTGKALNDSSSTRVVHADDQVQ